MNRIFRRFYKNSPKTFRPQNFKRYSNYQNHNSNLNSSKNYYKLAFTTPLAVSFFKTSKNEENDEKTLENITNSSLQELNSRSIYGWTILHEFVAKNNVKMVKKLLELGVDPDTTDHFTSSKTTANRLQKTEKEIENLRKSKFPITEDLDPG